ncbi:hypothetical protein ACFX2B_031640 [Malus domestica]
MEDATCSDLAALHFFPLENHVNHIPLGSKRTLMSSRRSLQFFLNWHLMSRRGRSLLSIFIHSKLHDSDQTSQCIRLDPLYLLFLEQPTFLSAKRTKQPTTFMVLSRGAQPSIPTGRRPACPTFQQPMRPAISLFLSITSLARVRSKSPKDMSHAARLALRPSATIRDPSCTSCLLAQAKPSCPSSGPCHNISSAHAEPTPGPCQPMCRTTPTAAPQ